MRNTLQVGGIILLLLGIVLLASAFAPGNPAEFPNNWKYAYAAVVTSGAFGKWGLVLIALGGLCMLVRAFIRR
jgi:hypothetical protein